MDSSGTQKAQAVEFPKLKKKLIIDVDTGMDDAQSLMMALGASYRVDILAITCVDGNTNLDQVCYNTMRLLKVCQDSKIPVFKGAHTSLLKEAVYEKTGLHGSDGMGGVPDSDPPDMSLLQKEHAVNAISRLAAEHKGEVTLVCLAPLTNIALALRMDSGLSNNLRNVVIMGGNIEAKGNVTATAEFNFYKDPESAFIVLENLKCPIQLVPLEPCLNNSIEWEWYDNVLCKIDTPLGKFHASFMQHTTRRRREVMKLPMYHSCDPLAMAVAVSPWCVTESQKCFCMVELNGTITRGQMIVDWKNKLKCQPNVEIVTEVDVNEMKKLYIEMLR